jgi:hypothetical protein
MQAIADDLMTRHEPHIPAAIQRCRQSDQSFGQRPRHQACAMISELEMRMLQALQLKT